MKLRTFFLATALATGIASMSMAQQSQMPMGGSSGGQMQAADNLPEGCRAAAQASGHGQMMQGGMSQSMQSGMQGMMGQMTETQRGLHEAMMKMNPAMMQGMMAKDADVAWICAMIPHHRGAIEMARAGLKGADNAESKRLAEETIESNQKEVEKLIAWVEKNASRESKNEAAGSPRQ